MNFILTVNIGLLVATFASALMMIDHMNRNTRHAVRLGAVLLLVGVVAEAVGYVAHWAAWTDTLFFGGAAMCLVANLRFPPGICAGREATPEEKARARRKADLYAYGVGVLTLIGLALAWALGGDL